MLNSEGTKLSVYLDLRASARPKKSKILEYFDLKMFNLSEIFQNLKSYQIVPFFGDFRENWS